MHMYSDTHVEVASRQCTTTCELLTLFDEQRVTLAVETLLNQLLNHSRLAATRLAKYNHALRTT